MKMKVLHSILLIYTILAVVGGNFTEVCDVEGSGVEDCSSEIYCCQQSECDILYRSDSKKENPIDVEYDSDNDYRCCDIIQYKSSPVPSDCKLCTICCDEVERKQIPLPSHCSKCRKCSHSSVFKKDNQNDRNTSLFMDDNTRCKKM